MPTLIDLTGKVFGYWLVIGKGPTVTGCKTIWYCVCQCGNEREVIGRNLTNGRSKSCGCLRIEKSLTKTPDHLKNTYNGAKKRCQLKSDPNYHNYGGRGIEFRFNSYAEFYAEVSPGWKPGLSLDRINNDGHYEAGNLRWATVAEQMENTRNSRLIEYKGIKQSLSKWARLIGVPRATLYWRYYAGWPIHEILKEY